MRIIDLIQNNEQMIKDLFSSGLLSYKIFFYRNLYLDYDINIKMGQSKSVAVICTADKFKVAEQTVYRAIKSMNKEMNCGE